MGPALGNPNGSSVPKEVRQASGRYRALPLGGIPESLLHPPTTQNVEVPGVTPAGLRSVLREWSTRHGFSVTSDTDPYVDMLAHHGVHGVHGWFFSERNLAPDRPTTHRRDRGRWAAVALGVPIGGWGWFEVVFGTPHTPVFLLGVLGAIGGCVAAGIAASSFPNSDFTSDVVAVSYSSAMAVGSSSLPIADRQATYLVRVTTGRALSQNWASQYGSGRNVLHLADEPDLARLRSDLEDVLRHSTGDSLPVADPGSPLTG